MRDALPAYPPEVDALVLRHLRQRRAHVFGPEHGHAVDPQGGHRCLAIAELLLCGDTGTERIAVDWLARSGKRWRPLLCVAAYRALDGNCSEIPADVRRLALAVECFHKASLIHDDIEDGDESRYGQPSLHCQHGTPIALNVGDFLLGEGYRLIASCSVPPARRTAMLAVAAEGHRTLCLGQGEELGWVRSPVPLQPDAVLAVFRRKTAPAFEVALRLGALCWDADETVCSVLQAYSRALGTAYQIRDDLTDGSGTAECDDIRAQRPSLLLALAWENAPRRDWAPALTGPDALAPAAVAAAIASSGAREKARMLLEHYKNESIRSLAPLQNAHLKTFLRRVVGRILGAEPGMSGVHKTESGDDGDQTE